MKITNVFSFFFYFHIFILVLMNKIYKTDFSPDRKCVVFNFYYLECVALLLIIHDFLFICY